MYSVLDQSALSKPRQLPKGPLLVYSLLTAVDRPITPRGHSIKYVISGVERYTINGRPFAVRPGEYLVANPCGLGQVYIKSDSPVAGLCVDLPSAHIEGMMAALVQPNEFERDSMMDYFNNEEFVENTFNAQGTQVGALMRSIASEVGQDPFRARTMTESIYLRLAEAYVMDNRGTMAMLRKVKAVRTSTRKEILRGVERARQLIHDVFAERLDVATMARTAGMSEFHFFRAFRQVHGCSPHKYLFDLRLTRAAEMLAMADAQVMDVAVRCGFADSASFSKAFRKTHGLPPSAWGVDRAASDN